MENRNLLTTIRISYNQFTRTGQKIADYVLNNADEVPYMSISQLADACHVADASVNRFCRALKVQGYQEFKLLISTSIQDSRDSESSRDSKGDLNEDTGICGQIMIDYIEAVKETKEVMGMDVVDKTVQMMLNADRIFFAGAGNSMVSALEAQTRFLHITPKVVCNMDTHMQAMTASMLTPKDMVLIFSYTGASQDTVNVAEIAKKRGAGVCVITHYKKSELTQYADTILLCAPKEGPLEGGSMVAKVSQLYLVEVLFQCYYQADAEQATENNRLTADSITSKFKSL